MESQNQEIRIVGFPFEPYTSDCFGLPDCEFPGVNAHVIIKVLKHIFDRYNISLIRTTSVAENERLLVEGRAEIAVNTGKASLERMAKLGGFPVDANRPMYVIKEELSESRKSDLLTSVAGVYSTVFVCTLLATLFLVRIVTKLFLKLRNRRLTHPVKIAITAALLVLTVLLGVYSNFLSIVLSRKPPYHQPFEDYTDLMTKIKKKECRFVLRKATLSDALTMEVVKPMLHNEWIPSELEILAMDAWRANPPLLVGGTGDMVESVVSKPCHIGVDWKLAQPWFEGRYCNVRYLEAEYGTIRREQLMFMFYRKDWKFGQVLKATLGEALQTQWLETIKYAATLEGTKNCSNLIAPLNPAITVRQLKDIFLILITTSLASAGILVLEIRLKRGKKVDHRE